MQHGLPRRVIGGGRPLVRENLADTDPPRCKTPIFNLFSLVAIAKSSIENNRKSTTRFSMSLR